MTSSCTLSTGSPEQKNWSTSPSTPRLFVGAKGLALRASQYGDFTAPIVLLLHGGGQTRHAWADTARTIAGAGYCAITLDARGHGESDWCAQGDYSTESLVADLNAVIHSLPTAPIIVGASMGGLTSMLALGENASLPCSALVLVDVAPRLEQQGVRRIIEFMRRHQDGFDSLEQVRDAIAAYNPHLPHRAIDVDRGTLRRHCGKRHDEAAAGDVERRQPGNQRLEGEGTHVPERCMLAQESEEFFAGFGSHGVSLISNVHVESGFQPLLQ